MDAMLTAMLNNLASCSGEASIEFVPSVSSTTAGTRPRLKSVG